MEWKEILAPALQSAEMQNIKKFLQEERVTKNIYPEGKNVFRAFDLCPFEKTRVVILGQDPYHTPGTADGLAFSTQQEVRPPSLEVIFKEIYKDLNIQYYYNKTFEEYFPTNNLEKWARNGFLLLNTSLTVEEGKPNSHKDLGWSNLIKMAIEGLNKAEGQVIFLFWGSVAKTFAQYVNPKSRHVSFFASHPAAELYKDSEGGFYGCRHFSIIRDVMPALEGRNVSPSINLDGCFDRKRAKEIVTEHYPIDAKRICEYIDKELIINVPFNRDLYFQEIRKFETLISTKYP